MNWEQELDIITKSKKSPRSFEPLYDKYYEQILRYVSMKIGNAAMAQDLTADTFFKALTKINLYKPTHSFSSWLYKIALNEIRGHFRKIKKENYLFNTEELVEPLHLFESHGENEWTEDLEKLLLAQKEKDLILLELRFFEGMSFKELGHVLEISEESAKKRMQRLLIKLRNDLKVKV